MAWLYEIASGRWSRGGILLAKGYSGNGSGLNNSAMMDVGNVGPIPVGFYTIGPVIMRHPKLGLYVMELIPDPANEMYKRFGFFNHGDNEHLNFTASDGCIVTPEFARHAVGYDLANDNTLQVISALNGPPPEEWNVT